MQVQVLGTDIIAERNAGLKMSMIISRKRPRSLSRCQLLEKTADIAKYLVEECIGVSPATMTS